jgi:hypothetical protein
MEEVVQVQSKIVQFSCPMYRLGIEYRAIAGGCTCTTRIVNGKLQNISYMYKYISHSECYGYNDNVAL